LGLNPFIIHSLSSNDIKTGIKAMKDVLKELENGL
jgi:hypothetical protein